MNNNGHHKIIPTGELLEQLKKTAQKQDHRGYSRLITQVDWQVANSQQLDDALGVCLAFGDMKRVAQLTQIGLARFPEQEAFGRVSRLFNPPPTSVVARRGLSSTEALDASMKWLQEHADDYQVGEWLAVRSGQLVAQAPTLPELDRLLGDHIAEAPLIHQVIA